MKTIKIIKGNSWYIDEVNNTFEVIGSTEHGDFYLVDAKGYMGRRVYKEDCEEIDFNGIERVFKKNFLEGMVNTDYKSFKETYPTLFKVILKSMEDVSCKK